MLRCLLVLCFLAATHGSQSFMQRREIEVPEFKPAEEQRPASRSSRDQLPKSLGLLEDLERLVERRERAMERTSWALGLLCVAALTSASFSARSMLRSKAD
ncbi:unnamed protein product [Effrenium voratum]|nr:unnamed protein product [Effrenium voratum]